MTRQAPSESAKNFNLNTVKKGQDKKTEYIVSKRSNGVKYWKILKKEKSKKSVKKEKSKKSVKKEKPKKSVKKEKKYLKEFEKIIKGKTIKDKYYGVQAINKAKQLFFPNNKKEADKWANSWTADEKKKAIYVTYFVKDNKYAKFIIGEGKKLSVLGQKI